MTRSATITAPPHRFTVDDYERMGKAGILCKDDRVELLDGQIVDKMTIGDRHAAVVDFLNRWFNRKLQDRAIVRVQNPVRMPPHSEPEPDISLLRPRDDFYAGGHPTPADTFLITEVADASLDQDLKVKAGIYADRGVSEYWVVDLTHDVLLVHRRPAGGSYQETRTLSPADVASPQAFPDLQLAVKDILRRPSV